MPNLFQSTPKFNKQKRIKPKSGLFITNTSHAGLRLASICYEEMYSVQR
jgi:hypothetical protein